MLVAAAAAAVVAVAARVVGRARSGTGPPSSY